MEPEDIASLRAEFEKFVREECSVALEPKSQSKALAASEERRFAFVDDLINNLLAPSKSGVYLSRLDIKRVAEALDESLPIKERKKMMMALFRHTTSKAYLRRAFDLFERHLQARQLIYRELAKAFPASSAIFESWCAKIDNTRTMFDRIVEDFEEIEPTSDPMMI